LAEGFWSVDQKQQARLHCVIPSSFVIWSVSGARFYSLLGGVRYAYVLAQGKKKKK
jgi:hypothetical protein